MNPQEIVREYAQRYWTEQGKHFDEFFSRYEDGWLDKIPYLHTIENFCERLNRAIEADEKICIYSDYDTDAITATGVMYWGLLKLGVQQENLGFYAPDRFTEGYGMNLEAAKKLAQEFDLIISVDCGVNSRQEAKVIAEAGKDLIITDHHQLVGDIPQAVAVINPQVHKVFGGQKEFQKIWSKNPNSFEPELVVDINDQQRYLSTSVTGVGVAWFCVLWLGYYLQMQGKEVDVRSLESLLALVAIGTIADCQSIIEPTNRLLTKMGLRVLQNNRSGIVGLDKLVELTGLQAKMREGYPITSQDLGYTLSPILNSSGRMNHARLSIRVLLAKTPQEGELLARELIETNQNRKQLVRDIVVEVESEAKKQFQEKSGIIWLEGDWSKGVIGLLASRIVNEHNLPVIVVSTEKANEAVASLRAPKGYDFPKAFQDVEEISKGGGHAQAAGFSAAQKDLKAIKNKLSQLLIDQQKLIKPDFEASKDLVDLPEELAAWKNKKELIVLSQDQINNDLLDRVWMMDPFGIDFPLPVFGLQLKITDTEITWMGQDKQHLKINLEDGFSVLLFNVNTIQKEQIIQMSQNNYKQFWIIAKPSKNAWRGKVKNDLIIDKYWILDK